MPFLDQARLFFDAEIVVAPHGAALANLVFSRPGTRMMEIFTPAWMPPCFYALARAGGLKYAYMVGQEQDQDAADARLSDMAIPIDTLRSKILRLIG
jgi:capsular polysaccharide biosynthesis protein